jgi:hypothetical protein
MSETHSFQLLSEISTPVPRDHHGLLFQCAPDAPGLTGATAAVPLVELIGEFDMVKQQAARLARKLLQDEPLVRGLQQLAIFEELVIRELQQIIHAKNLHDTLLKRGVTQCSIAGDEPIAEHLLAVAKACGSQLEIDACTSTRKSRKRFASIHRSFDRILESGFHRGVVAREFNEAVSRIDPYHRRPRLTRVRPQKGGIWFYSTAHTFTAIGLLYESWFPQQFQFLVENPITGGVPLSMHQRKFASPYDYVANGHAPESGEAELATQIIRAHLASVDVDDEERTLVKVYLDGPGFATFERRLLPKGLFQTALFRRFVEQVAPACIVVGNPVFEGYLLHAARNAGVPTILLQHGILGDFCQFIDPPVDHYVVRGQFWRDFLPAPAANRAHVLNPPQTSVTEVQSGTRTKVVFLTAPYAQIRFSASSDLRDILCSLLHVCRENDATLVIRVHPMEQIGYYARLVSSMPESVGVSIEYSQGPGLMQLLSHAAAAVTYCSTVFLDCLRFRVPIISFDWHNFSFKKQITKEKVFHFAASLENLKNLVRKALRAELPAFEGATDPFLGQTQEQCLRNQLAVLLQHH